MHCAGRAGLGLHLTDVERLSVDVFEALARPLVRDLAHGGRGRDGVNGRGFAHGVGHMRCRGVAVHRLHFFRHVLIPLSHMEGLDMLVA